MRNLIIDIGNFCCVYRMKLPKKLTSEILHQNPWWIYRHDTFQRTDGTVGDYYYGDEIGPVMVVAALADGRLLLTRQFRYLMDKMSIEFPCGGRDLPETDEMTGRRELLEETGYALKSLEPVGNFETMNGLFKSPTGVMLCKELNKIA